MPNLPNCLCGLGRYWKTKCRARHTIFALKCYNVLWDINILSHPWIKNSRLISLHPYGQLLEIMKLICVTWSNINIICVLLYDNLVWYIAQTTYAVCLLSVLGGFFVVNPSQSHVCLKRLHKCVKVLMNRSIGSI